MYNIDMKRKFDLIIANPPYSSGAIIMQKVLDEIDFDQCMCIMPTSEFNKKMSNSEDFLFNYEKRIHIFSKKESAEIFYGAGCPPLEIGALCKIKQNNHSQLEVLCSKDNFLLGWYYENISRILPYSVHGTMLRRARFGIKERASAFYEKSLDILTDDFFQRSIVFGVYFVNNGVHKDDGNAIDNFWNYKLNSIKEFKDKVIELNAHPDLHCIEFKSHTEKVNCNKWMREGNLYSILLKKLDSGGSIELIRDIIIPHVDWSKEWSDEEILKEYGYTQDEIETILNLN